MASLAVTVPLAPPAAAHGTVDQLLAGDPVCNNDSFRAFVQGGVDAAPLLTQTFVPATSRLVGVDLCVNVIDRNTTVTARIVDPSTAEGTVVAEGATVARETGFQHLHVDLTGTLDTVPGKQLVLEVPSSPAFAWHGTCADVSGTCTSVDEDLYPAGQSNFTTASGGVLDFAFRTHTGSGSAVSDSEKLFVAGLEPGSTTIRFDTDATGNTIPSGTVITNQFPGVTFSSPSPNEPLETFNSSAAVSAPNMLFGGFPPDGARTNQDPQIFEATFTERVTAVGFYISAHDPTASDVSIEVSLAGHASSQRFALADDDAMETTPFYFGLSSATPIESVRVLSGFEGGGASGFEEIGLDDFTFGHAAVPAAPTGPGRIVFGSDRDGDFDIYVAAEDGSGVVQLTDAPAPDTDPSFSPDGSRIAFVAQRDGHPQIYTMDADGSNQERLVVSSTFDADPAWSPDGTKIAFARDLGGQFDTFVVNADGSGTPVNVTNHPAFLDSFPTWSPDGSQIAFRSSRNGNLDIYVANVDGTGAQTQLTSDAGDDDVPAWSPDGSQIAFTTTRDGDQEIYVMDATGSNQRAVAVRSGSVDSLPAWSPDGTRLVFGSRATNWKATELHVVDVGVPGTQAHPITNASATSDGADWADNLTLNVEGVIESGPSGEVGLSRPPDVEVPASPSAVPLEHVPAQLSPGVIDTAPLSSLPRLAPLSSLPRLAPLSSLPRLAPLSSLPRLAPLSSLPRLAPLSSLPRLAPLSSLPRLAPLSSLPRLAPAAKDVLDQVSLLSLVFATGVEAVIAPPSLLAGRQPQDVSLGEALQDPDSRQRLESMGWDEVTLAESLLHEIGLGAILLGDTPLSAYSATGFDFCAALDGLRQRTDCSADLGGITGLSLLDLQVLGLNIADGEHGIPFHTFRLGDIVLAPDAPLREASIPGTDLRKAALGSVLVADIPAASRPNVVNCSDPAVFDCGTGRLYDAQQAGALVADAELDDLAGAADDLTLGELVYGLIGVDATPYEAFPPDQLGILTYEGADTSRLRYELGYAPVGVADVASPIFTIVFPETFAVDPASATLSVESPHSGGVVIASTTSLPVTASVDTSADGVVLTAEVEGIIPAGSVAVLDVTAYPGLTPGRRATSASVVAANVNQVLTNRAPVTVTENFEPNDDLAAAIPLSPDVLYLATPGGRDYYSVSASPGSIIEVFLGNAGSGDNDLVVYYPDGVGAAEPLRQPTRAERPVVPITDNGPTLSQGGEPLSAETRQDLFIADRAVAGISDNRSRENEVVQFVALPGGDDTYIIQVTPYLDDALHGPYSVRVRTTAPTPPPPCTPRDDAYFPFPVAPHVAAMSSPPTSVASDRTSLFIVDWARLSRFYDDPATAEVETQAVHDKLQELVAHPKVNGVILPINAYPAIATEQAEADLNPCAVQPTNDVVRAINDTVDGLLAGSAADIRHVNLVGSEEVVPRALVPDVTQVGNEALFTQQLQLVFPGENNSLIGAGSHVRTDDPYADFNPTPYLGRWQYISEDAVSRISETPSELIEAMQTFIDYDGVLQASSALTTGSDLFMQDLAEAQDEAVESFLLDNPQPDLISTSWTADQLRTALAGPAGGDSPQLAGLNGHADQFRLEAPGSIGDPFTTADLDLLSDRIRGTVLYSIGCHSLQSPADVLLTAGGDPARVRDWGQASAGNGALFAGQAGFGLGLEATIAFSEDVMLRFARNLDGTMTVGEALAAAKHAYIAEKGVLSVYDEKAAVQTGLFGLSMFEVAVDPALAPATSSPPAATSSSASVLDVSGLSTDPATGLQAVTVHSEPDFQRVHVPGLGSYDAVDGETYEAHYRPVQGKVDVDVTVDGLRAHGAAPIALVSSDEAGFDPVFAMPALAAGPSQPPEPQFGNVIFPAAPTQLTSTTGPEGERDNLVIVPGQFQARSVDGDGNVIGEQTRITSSDTMVWYSTSDDFIQPVIHSFESFKTGQTVMFQAEVTDQTPAGPGELSLVYVLFRDDVGWHNVQLSRVGTSDDFVASTSFVGTDVESAVIAVDLAGNVGSSWNKGDRFDAAVLPEPPAGITAAVTSGSAPVNGWYLDAQVTLDAGGVAIEYSLDGADFVDYSGPFTITETGLHVVSYRAANGLEGALVVPVDADPPVITSIDAPVDPQPAGAAVQAVVEFADPRASTAHVATIAWGDGTSSSPAVSAGAGSGTATASHTYAAPGIYTVTATVTDPEGQSDTESYQYVVVYDPNGGFVTGGGHISSPAGAYTADPSLTGKATFGFVSKYKKGANIPSGNTQFRFNAAGFSFTSDVYEWLVVSGARAQFKGHGAVNGEAGYSFMLTAVDGQINGGGGTDKLRMKVWRTVSGTIVYDNQLGDGDDAQPSTAIAGGSITIKK